MTYFSTTTDRPTGSPCQRLWGVIVKHIYKTLWPAYKYILLDVHVSFNQSLPIVVFNWDMIPLNHGISTTSSHTIEWKLSEKFQREEMVLQANNPSVPQGCIELVSQACDPSPVSRGIARPRYVIWPSRSIPVQQVWAGGWGTCVPRCPEALQSAH